MENKAWSKDPTFLFHKRFLCMERDLYMGKCQNVVVFLKTEGRPIKSSLVKVGMEGGGQAVHCIEENEQLERIYLPTRKSHGICNTTSGIYQSKTLQPCAASFTPMKLNCIFSA